MVFGAAAPTPNTTATPKSRTMHELVINLHMHTRYSDGFGSHQDIAEAALQAGLDAVVVTDHNVLVNGPEGYYRNGNQKVLLLVGEEIHDQTLQPSKNHLLVLGAGRELAHMATDPQRLIDAVRRHEGLSFLAHPFEDASPAIGELDFSWEAWPVQGFTGLEIWNAMSELKTRIRSRLHAIFYILFPRRIARGPSGEALQKWDELLSQGQQVVAVGGTDAHAFPYRLGPMRRTIFPYHFHFATVNTHLLTPSPLRGDVDHDRRLVLDALRQGHAFIGYDLPAPTRGFRFSAQGKSGRAWMGDTISAENGVTFQIRLPLVTECRLVRHGKVVRTWQQRQTCTHITSEPGAYRVEVYIPYNGRRRGWIFSNPIYVV